MEWAEAGTAPDQTQPQAGAGLARPSCPARGRQEGRCWRWWVRPVRAGRLDGKGANRASVLTEEGFKAEAFDRVPSQRGTVSTGVVIPPGRLTRNGLPRCPPQAESGEPTAWQVWGLISPNPLPAVPWKHTPQLLTQFGRVEVFAIKHQLVLALPQASRCRRSRNAYRPGGTHGAVLSLNQRIALARTTSGRQLIVEKF